MIVARLALLLAANFDFMIDRLLQAKCGGAGGGPARLEAFQARLARDDGDDGWAMSKGSVQLDAGRQV